MIRSLLFFLLLISLTSLSTYAQVVEKKKKERFLQKIHTVGFEDENTQIYIDLMRISMPKGFQKSSYPKFMIVGKDNKLIFGIGGAVYFQSGYDFKGVINNSDFSPYDVPTIVDPGNENRFFMDASTSRLFFKLLAANSKAKGFEAYIEVDFRGGNNVLRLREAYIAFKGLTLGQTVSNFCDLNASPYTIDSGGPNGYTYKRNLLVSYKYSVKRFSFAASLEFPELSGTFDKYTKYSYQKMPDIPLYAQYNWRSSHIRLSSIFRNLSYYDTQNKKSKSEFGWGVQFSGSVLLSKSVRTYFQVVYGNGIANYISDLNERGFDITPDHNHTGTLTTVPAIGWFGGLEITLPKNISINMVFSEARAFDDISPINTDQYKAGKYLASNLSWEVFPGTFRVGVEYLHGMRTNLDKQTGYSNRIIFGIKLNF